METKKGFQLRNPSSLLLDYISTRERGFTKSVWYKFNSNYQYEIVNDWINFVVLNKRVDRKIITQRIK